MRNYRLLEFLAAVQRHNDTAATLMRTASMDALELQVAVVTAQQKGFVAPTGKIHPALSLTADGRAWAATQLAPFAALMRLPTASAGGV